ncbi:LAETG motif-containing sortase-dependent surface protein [Streptomyces abikoensis]|uniref:LAETG motif-containing sortase-dependent surface protein n=1 Tax=Streptomyces abikoensis TaxID=97398 RepID=A0ABW7T341_9ACTN
MQISRIATIVAAGVITPALFLTTPAVAEERPDAAGRTTIEQGTQTVEQPGTVPAEKTDKGKDTSFRIPVALEGPAAVEAGPGNWAQFKMSFDNSNGDKDVTFKPYLAYLPSKPDVAKEKDYAIRVQFRKGPDARLHDAQLTPDYGRDGKSLTFSGSLESYEVKKGENATFDLLVNFDERTPAHTARLRVTAEDKAAVTAEHEFSVKAAKPKPEPSKSATATASTSATATATASGKTTASPKATASASATASPSASSSSSADAAGTTSGGSGGSGTTANGSRTELAATGSDPATPWIAAGGAAAIIAGAGLVVATRRRAGAQG